MWAQEGMSKAEVMIETPMDGLPDAFDQPALSQCSRPSPLPRLRSVLILVWVNKCVVCKITVE